MKGLKKYFNNRVEKINQLLSRPGQKFTAAAFHHLRVEIKKLNALLEMINSCALHFRLKKSSRYTKQLFRLAGKVRELQLEEAMLKRYLPGRPKSGYLDLLKKLLSREKERFYLLINPGFINYLNMSWIELLPYFDELNKKKLDHYLNDRQKKIRELVLQKNLKVGQIHELRKRLKQLDYNRKSLGLTSEDKTQKSVVSITDLLGKWHDCLVMTGHLKKAIHSGQLGEQEMGQIQRVKTKLIVKSKVLLGRIKSSI